MKKRNRFSVLSSITMATLCACSGLILTGCGSKTPTAVEKAGEAVKDVAEDTKAAVGDAAKGVGDAAKSATEAAGAAADVAADAAGEMAEKAGDALSEGFAAAAAKATTALEGIDGGTEILTKIKGLFGLAEETLQGITDSDTAQASLAKLGELGGTVDGLAELTEKLPESARSAVQSLVASGHAQLNAIIEKVNGLPGVEDVIKPKLDELMAKLTALSGK